MNLIRRIIGRQRFISYLETKATDENWRDSKLWEKLPCLKWVWTRKLYFRYLLTFGKNKRNNNPMLGMGRNFWLYPTDMDSWMRLASFGAPMRVQQELYKLGEL